MKRKYRWRCFACDEANAASATSCSSCGFPAVATEAEIARGRAARRRGMSPVPTSEWAPAAAPAQALAGWGRWRMGIALAGAILLALGASAGMHALSWHGLGVAVFALLFGSVLLMVALAARGAIATT